MSMSDCTKCWSTPCECGHDYRDWSKERLQKFIKTLQEVSTVVHGADLEQTKFLAGPELSAAIEKHTRDLALQSTPKLISVRIGHAPDSDYMLLNGKEQLLAPRPKTDSASECFLPNGTPVIISPLRSIHDWMPRYRIAITLHGEKFYRDLKQGEFVLFSEEKLEEFFYPFAYVHVVRNDSPSRWRIPLENLEAAINFDPKEHTHE